MSRFLAQIVARSAAPSAAVEPRLAARYEPPAQAPSIEMKSDRWGEDIDVSPVDSTGAGTEHATQLEYPTRHEPRTAAFGAAGAASADPPASAPGRRAAVPSISSLIPSGPIGSVRSFDAAATAPIPSIQWTEHERELTLAAHREDGPPRSYAVPQPARPIMPIPGPGSPSLVAGAAARPSVDGPAGVNPTNGAATNGSALLPGATDALAIRPGAPPTLQRSTDPPTPPQPTIQVTIGRVEVRAAAEPAARRRGKERDQSNVMALDEYLSRRAGEGR